jgi:hypothetical protein
MGFKLATSKSRITLRQPVPNEPPPLPFPATDAQKDFIGRDVYSYSPRTSKPEVLAAWGDGTPARRHYRLSEAVDIATKNATNNVQYTLDTFLTLGEMEVIKLFIIPPPGVKLLPVDKFSHKKLGKPVVEPEFATIFPHDCSQILAHNKVSLSNFGSAYKINFNELLLLGDGKPNPWFGNQDYVWRAFEDDVIFVLTVTHNDLFVWHDDLLQLIQHQNATVVTNKESSPLSQTVSDTQVADQLPFSFKAEKHTSAKLIILNDVASEFWANATPKDTNDIKKIHEKVIEALTSRLKKLRFCKPNSLNAAANIICPEYKLDRSEATKDKDDKEVHRLHILGNLYPTLQFVALVDASEHFWSKRFIGKRVTSGVKSAEVISWLQKKHDFITLRATVGAQIIRPENAPKGAIKKTPQPIDTI